MAISPFTPISEEGATDWKQSVRVVTSAALPAYTRTANVITADDNGTIPTIDGITVIGGNRVLLKDGAAGPDNGPYSVTDEGSGSTPWILTRTSDADISADISSGTVFVPEEGEQAGTIWVLTTPNPIVLNTTALTFTSVTSFDHIAAALAAADSTIDFNGQVLQNVGDGVSGTDAATVQQIPTTLPEFTDVDDNAEPTKGSLLVGDGTEWAEFPAGADGNVLVYDSSEPYGFLIVEPDEVGIQDHGILTGLTDDDHPQYLNRVEEGAPGGYPTLDFDEDDPRIQPQYLTLHAATHSVAGIDPISHNNLAGLTTGDPHTQYQEEDEKDQASGYLGLNSNTRFAFSKIEQATNRVLGRGAASTGATQELTPSANITVGDGTLDTVQGIQTSSTPQFAGLGIGVAPGTGGTIKMATQAPAALGEIGMDATTGRVQAYIGGGSKNLAHLSEVELTANKDQASGYLGLNSSTRFAFSKIEQATNRVLGRGASGTGATQELTPSSNLSVGDGTIDTVQGIQTSSTPRFAGLGIGVAAGTSGTIKIATQDPAAAGEFGSSTSTGYLRAYVGGAATNVEVQANKNAASGYLGLNSSTRFTGTTYIEQSTAKILGRISASTGATEEISVVSPLSLSSGNLTTLMSTSKILGRTTASPGVIEELGVSSPFSLSSGNLTSSMTTNRILGRTTASSGEIEQLTPIAVTLSSGNINLNSTTASATDSINTTSGTYAVMTNLTLTPGAGTYILLMYCVINASAAMTATFGVHVNGSLVTGQERAQVIGAAVTNGFQSFITSVTPGASEAVDIRWKTSAGTLTSPTGRYLTLIRVT